MSTQVKVPSIPSCDVCQSEGVKTPAYADAKLNIGPWANVCKMHFDAHSCSLGTGHGQKLILATEPEPSQDERIRENLRGADFENMTFEDFEDMFEDRDPCEFL